MEENKTNNEPKELDLIDIIKLCIKTVKKCIDAIKAAIISVLRINIKYWYIILLFIAAGIGYAVATKTQEQTCADFYLKMPFVPAKMAINNIKDLNSRIDGNGNAELAKTLGLSKNDVKNITSICAYKVCDTDGDEYPDKDVVKANDTSIMSMKHILHAYISSNGDCDFELIKNAIISYNNKDSMIANVSEYNYKTQVNELNLYESEIRQIDSARAKIASSGKFSIDKNGESMQFSGDPYSIKEMQNLIEMCAKIRFYMTSQTIPVASFSPIFVNNTGSSTNRTIRIIILFYFASLVIAYIVKNRKNIKAALKEE